MTQYLRAKTNGFIMEHNERLALLPEWESVTEQEAFPERFAPVDLEAREPQVDITVNAEVESPVVVSPELEVEATRRFKKPRMATTAGLKGAD